MRLVRSNRFESAENTGAPFQTNSLEFGKDALIDRWRLYKIAHQASPQSKGAHYPVSHDRAKRTERDRPSSNTVALPQEVELMPQYQNFSFKAAVAI